MATDNNNLKKRIAIQIRVDEEKRDKFKNYCDKLGTTMSDELKRYITRCCNSDNNLQ